MPKRQVANISPAITQPHFLIKSFYLGKYALTPDSDFSEEEAYQLLDILRNRRAAVRYKIKLAAKVNGFGLQRTRTVMRTSMVHMLEHFISYNSIKRLFVFRIEPTVLMLGVLVVPPIDQQQRQQQMLKAGETITHKFFQVLKFDTVADLNAVCDEIARIRAGEIISASRHTYSSDRPGSVHVSGSGSPSSFKTNSRDGRRRTTGKNGSNLVHTESILIAGQNAYYDGDENAGSMGARSGDSWKMGANMSLEMSNNPNPNLGRNENGTYLNHDTANGFDQSNGNFQAKIDPANQSRGGNGFDEVVPLYSYQQFRNPNSHERSQQMPNAGVGVSPTAGTSNFSVTGSGDYNGHDRYGGGIENKAFALQEDLWESSGIFLEYDSKRDVTSVVPTGPIYMFSAHQLTIHDSSELTCESESEI